MLKQISAQGQRSDKLPEGAHGKLTQREAAAEAGISEHQQLQATQVARVPQAEFDKQVESEKPPTVTKLAEQGRKERPKPVVVDHTEGRDQRQVGGSIPSRSRSAQRLNSGGAPISSTSIRR